MAGFLKIIGGIVFILAAVAGVLSLNAGGEITLVTVLPAMVGGAATYGLGDIMQNVREIRNHTKRQADAMERVERLADPQQDGFAPLKRVRNLGD